MCKYPGRDIQPKGFLLVEVMVAVGVLALGLVLVLGALRQTLKAVGTIEEVSTCAWLAQAKMWGWEYLENQNELLDLEAQKGNLEKPDGYAWSMTPSARESSSLTEVTLVVDRPGGKGITVTTLLEAGP